MEKIRKNWHIIIILLLLIISITSIFLSIKFNKKNLKVKAEENTETWQPIQVTLNEDLSNKRFIFNQNFIYNYNLENNDKYGRYYIQYYNERLYPIAQNNDNNIIITTIFFETYNDYINIYISVELQNGNTMQIYNAYKNLNQTPIINTNEQNYMNLIYTTTNVINNKTTNTIDNVEYYNKVASEFLLFEPQQTIETPTLTNELNTLIWNNIDNAKYELYKNNELITQTYNTRYVAISNGTYKVRAVVNGRYSDFSNEIIINDIEEQGQYTFLTLFGNLVDSQLYLIQSMLNFEVLGFNLYQLFTAILTICIIIIICKIALFK